MEPTQTFIRKNKAGKVAAVCWSLVVVASLYLMAGVGKGTADAPETSALFAGLIAVVGVLAGIVYGTIWIVGAPDKTNNLENHHTPKYLVPILLILVIIIAVLAYSQI